PKKGDASDLDPTQAPSVFDIDVLRVARVYAEALLNAAEKQGKVDEIWEQLVALVGAPLRRSDSPTDPMVLLVVGTPRGRREEIIRKAFGGRVDDLFLKFLLVLNRHDQLEILRAVAAVYRELMDERSRNVRVQVQSAVPLTDAERDKVKELARDRFRDMNPVLVESVDPALLGGLRIQVGDQVIDATVRTRLESLKNQLLARSSHAIRR
ncbi:MAG TPA: ATP synthase F1 subunit delta, partial [Gemmataceae bacterium]